MPNPNATTRTPLNAPQTGTQRLRAQARPPRTDHNTFEPVIALSIIVFPFIALLGIAIAEGLGLLA